MTAMEKWFNRYRRYDSEMPSRFDLVLDYRVWRYFLYRLRFVLPVAALRFMVHIFEYLLFFHVLSTDNLMPLLLLRVSLLFIENGWWGALDVMRRHIRDARAERDHSVLVRNIVERWYSGAVVLGFALLGLTVAAIPRFDLPDAFALILIALTIQLAIRLQIRVVYMAGFAFQRLFLPILYIVLTDLFIMLTVWAGRAWLGDWAPILAISLSALLSIYIAYRYIKPVTDLHRITPKRLQLALPNIKLHKLGEQMTYVMSGMAFVLTRAWPLFLLCWSWERLHNTGYGTEVFTFIYLMYPIFHSMYAWPALFFHDLSRFGLDVFKGFRTTYLRGLLVVGLIMSLVYLTPVLVTGDLFLNYDMSSSYFVWVYVFMPVSGLLAVQQLAMISVGAYKPLIIYPLLCASAMLGISYWADLDAYQIFYVMTVGLTLLTVLYVKPFLTMPKNEWEYLPYPIWKWSLDKRPAPGGIWQVEFNTAFTVGRIRAVSKQLDSMGRSCFYKRKALLFAADELLDVDQIIRALGGAAYRVTRVPTLHKWEEQHQLLVKQLSASALLPSVYEKEWDPETDQQTDLPLWLRREIINEARRANQPSTKRRSRFVRVSPTFEDDQIAKLRVYIRKEALEKS